MLDLNKETPIIQLLRTAKIEGAISDWTVDGYYIILHRHDSKLAVFLTDARSYLRGVLGLPRSAVIPVAEA